MKTSDVSFLPEKPGCYLFKNVNKEIIYVGKAKNLKKRVSSYFQKRDLDPKTRLLVFEIAELDFIETKTELDALLLENNLIKKNYPKYNLDLKDSRRYAYILIHQDDIPWIEVARVREGNGEYYGPFVSGANRKLIMDVLTRTFKILYKKASPRYRKLIDKKEYAQRVHAARLILKGNVNELIKELNAKMLKASKESNYEYALIVKRQIEALEYLKEKQTIEMTRAVDAHIINYQIISDFVYLIVFSLRRGVLEEKQEYSFPYIEHFFSDFLLRYYEDAPIPQELVVPTPVSPAFAEYLSQKSKRKVSVIVPKKGNKKELLDLVALNIQNTFFAGSDRLIALKEILSLPILPRYIECFDISHLGGTNTVASMVAFTNGLPDKSNYRKFKIKTAEGGDDYLAMREVVKRRYGGTLKDKMKKPDLIVIDGGAGQLSSAISSLNELGLKIPIISLAKRLEEIYIPNTSAPILIDKKNKGLQLLQALRDEAHRFAITYQRSLRRRDFGR